MQALIDGKTLESFNCKLAKLEGGNFVCDEGYEIPNFKNHTSWEVHKDTLEFWISVFQGGMAGLYSSKKESKEDSKHSGYIKTIKVREVTE